MTILAVANPVFQPAMRIISNITNGYPAQVTTTFAHQYITGTIVRLYVPAGYGMVEANQLKGPIVVTGDTTFTIDLDTTSFTAYSAPVLSDDMQYAQVVPIGEVNGILTAATRNVLPYSAS